MYAPGGVGIAPREEEEDAREARISFAFREAGTFVLAIFGSWLAINHAAFYTFPPDLAKRAGVDVLTYVFLAVILYLALHAAVALLRPTPRATRRRHPLAALAGGSHVSGRPELARRPPRAALAESQRRHVETVLALRRAISAAQLHWDETTGQGALEDLAATVAPENPEVRLPDPMPLPERRLRPVPVQRRVIRAGPRRSLRTPSPWETPVAPPSRPGERTRPGS